MKLQSNTTVKAQKLNSKHFLPKGTSRPEEAPMIGKPSCAVLATDIHCILNAAAECVWLQEIWCMQFVSWVPTFVSCEIV